MPVRTITPQAFKRKIARLAKDVEGSCKRAMRETAVFGVTAIARQAHRTSPRPRATGQYLQGWVWRATPVGAVVGNATKQARYVEIGRRAGKAPPLDAIVAWAKAKRLPRRGKGKRGGSLAQARKSFAFAVQRKIARKGTPGRGVLRKSFPAIAKRARRELLLAVTAALRSP